MQEAISFFSEGYRLQGDVYVPDGLKQGERRPGVLLCHGYTGLKDLYLPDTARTLNQAGYVVLAFDYKGWGESEGAPHRLAPHSRVTDAHSALTFLAQCPQVDPDSIGLFGWSHGGSIVVWLAAIDRRAKCVVSAVAPGNGARWMEAVRTPEEWTELRERSEADRVSRVLTGASQFVPRGDILRMDPESMRLSAQSRKETSAAGADSLPLEFVDETIGFNPEWVVGHIAPRPVLFITCENDLVVPPEESEEMYKRAKDPKKLVVIEDRGHYDAYFGDTFTRVMEEAAAWFGSHLKGA